MHLKRVIPCLDVDAGRVVKGTNFVDIRDAGDPVELAERYDAEGADELVFLDITATHEKRDTIVELARRTADNVFIPFTIGGGIRSVRDAQAVLDAGADKVSVNSAAVARPELIDELAGRFGSQCVVLAIDAKQVAGGGEPAWEVFVAGGRTPTGRDAVAWAREGVGRGAGEILLTSMDRDGTNDGYDIALTARRRRRGRRARHRLGRRGHARPPRGGARRGRRRGAVRLDLPLRHLPRGRGQGAPGRGGDRRPSLAPPRPAHGAVVGALDAHERAREAARRAAVVRDADLAPGAPARAVDADRPAARLDAPLQAALAGALGPRAAAVGGIPAGDRAAREARPRARVAARRPAVAERMNRLE